MSDATDPPVVETLCRDDRCVERGICTCPPVDLFAHLAAETRRLWERHGYAVHVQTNDKRVVVRWPNG